MPGNIVGPPLDGYVQDQIDTRQKVLGNNPEVGSLGERVLNNHDKGAWVRLSSSVDLKGTEILKSFPTFNEQGSKLAKSFVLFGGVYNYSEGLTNGGRLGGVVPNLDVRANLLEASKYSYGLGSSDYALEALPGLETVKIVHVNRGAIRKFDIKLIVNNKDQLEIMETLYLRLGYYLLLEWGNTKYFDANKDWISDTPSPSRAFDAFFDEKGANNLEIENKIQETRGSTGGNYDGALFKVSNFSWSLNEDGSYAITINGISKGGLIDSLMVNANRINEEGANHSIEDYIIPTTDDAQKANIIKKLTGGMVFPPSPAISFSELYEKFISNLIENGKFERLKNAGAIEVPDSSKSTLNLNLASDTTSEDSSITVSDQNSSVLNKILFQYSLALKENDWIKVDRKNRYKRGSGRVNYLESIGLGDLPEAVSIKFDNPENAENAFEYNYITLGTLLSIIQEKILSLPNNANVGISTGYNDNLMFTHWFQHSTDPKICLIPFSYDKNDKQALVDQLSNSFRTDNPHAGRLMAIHVNIEYIISTLNATKDTKGHSNLFSFLEKLMIGIQPTLGNMNSFLVTYDDYSGLNIKDDTQIPGVGVDQAHTPLRLNGLQPLSQGSFVRRVGATSKITGKLATQIAIGSNTSGGDSHINNSTALLSRWNTGLVDRIQRKEDEENTSSTTTNEDLLDSINKKYFFQVDFVKKTYVNFQYLGSATNSTAQSNLQTILEYDLAVKTVNGDIAGIGFIPIDLSIEMDGISGIKLFQKIKTTEEILPISYINKVDFIVTALDHTIQNNEWVTLVNTLSVPKKPIKAANITGETKEGEFSLLKPPTEEE